MIFASLFAFTTWLERKILARIQNRIGPNYINIPFTKFRKTFGLLQPAADGFKMLVKEDIVPHGADRFLHLLAPILALVPAMMVLCLLPFDLPFANESMKRIHAAALDNAVLLFFGITSINTLAVFMAGWASRNKYSLLGGMRAVAQMVSYEIPLVLSAAVVIMAVGSLSAQKIVAAQSTHWFIFTPWGLAAFFIFFIASLAETNRSPFDLPEAESEIIAGYFTEYSGFKFALFFLGEYLSIFAINGLAVTLFFGGGNGPWVQAHPWLSCVWFLAKIFGLIFIIIWLRGTVPRLRVDQLMAFAWKFLMPLSILNLFVAAVALKVQQPWLTWPLCALVLYAAAHGLSRLQQKNVGPRTYQYAE
ncbi:MAG: NADH-quinone oxidoreductase subunit NuoH [Pedosphaera sp.]|nr:NADH-quinone oxidoreductase subunit NuoH [Pedosphaera sp.]MSU44090.1 NADH-quinone oxidoreductase subunit NuoH [Pedosphaera sp.]